MREPRGKREAERKASGLGYGHAPVMWQVHGLATELCKQKGGSFPKSENSPPSEVLLET